MPILPVGFGSAKRANPITRSIEKSSKDWAKYEGDKIPSSLELDDVFFNYISPEDSVLDVGTGFGKTMMDLFNRGYKKLEGIDPNSTGIEYAKNQIKAGRLAGEFIVGDATNLPYPNGSKNAVVTQAVFTTIVDPLARQKAISEIYRVLKKGGIFYMADFGQTPSIEKYAKRYDDGVKKGYEKGTFDVIDKETGKLEYQAHHHTKEELNKWLKEAGFKIEVYKVKPVHTRSGSEINGHFVIARKI